ncbi:MAG: cyclic nucleotide-binding domain-containing protein [Geitlerinemataceae cyanobacterium]
MKCKNVFELCTDFLQGLLGRDAATIAETEIWSLVSKLEIHRLAPGDILCTQGHISQSAYILVGGTIDGCVEYVGDTRTKTFSLQSGAILGEICLLTGLPHTATLRARDNAELLKLSRAAFVTLLSLQSRIPRILADLAIARQTDDETYLEHLPNLSEAAAHHEIAPTAIDPLSGLAAFCRFLLDARRA